MAGKSRPALKLAGVQQRLIVAGEFERIAAFPCSRLWLRFLGENGIPGEDLNDGRSTKPESS